MWLIPVPSAIGPMKYHDLGPIPDDAIPDSLLGHTTGSAGLNGVGKLMPTKSTSNTIV